MKLNQIESIFYNTLIKYLENENICINNKIFEVEKFDNGYCLFEKHEKCICFDIEVQQKNECFSGYIPDFAIYLGGKFEGFVIEIDGYEWHEKTKEQARIDKEKDRTYIKNSFIPIRFTGYEVYHHVDSCIKEVFEILELNSKLFDYDVLDGKLYSARKERDEYHEKFINTNFDCETQKAIHFKKGHIHIIPNAIEKNIPWECFA